LFRPAKMGTHNRRFRDRTARQNAMGVARHPRNRSGSGRLRANIAAENAGGTDSDVGNCVSASCVKNAYWFSARRFASQTIDLDHCS
jgi:hypothetical protein